MQQKMIHVKPAPGFRILNPFNRNAELSRDGEVVPDESFWRRRAAEGGVIITDTDELPTN